MQSIQEVIRNLRAKKKLGQNFLSDPQLLKRIVESASPLSGHTLIEVGPGPGGLSREIIKFAYKEYFLIEKDERCHPYLEALQPHNNAPFHLLHADATNLPLHTLGTAPRKIIANLPYNVSVPLLLQWLQHITSFESLTLMFQKEVADRLRASPKHSAYGRLSVMCQAFARVEKLFDVAPGAFYPPPKVTSTLVRLTPLALQRIIPWQPLEAVTKAAFSQRRKMLRSSLKGIISCSLLESLNIPSTHRAEDLSVKDFITLAEEFEKLQTSKT